MRYIPASRRAPATAHDTVYQETGVLTVIEFTRTKRESKHLEELFLSTAGPDRTRDHPTPLTTLCPD